MNNLSPIHRAIALFGSEAKLAAAVGVKQPSINAAKRANRVSAELAARIHKATNGTVSREELRPDLFGEQQ